VSAEQLCFFRFPKPLLERFGADFFKAIPKEPGVYLFAGAAKRILYVGQSHNLKVRLSYYKNAQPEREPRKIIKLVHQTETITWECCPSAEAAQLREVELIQQHRPKFNVAHTLSPTYTFFGLRVAEDTLHIRLRLRNEPANNESWFGAFKNHGLCRRALAALARFLWAEANQVTSIYDFPLWLHDRGRLRDFTFPLAAPWFESICALINGDESTIQKRCEERLLSEGDPFLKKLREHDLLTLAEFHELTSGFKTLRDFHALPQPIEQNSLDTLLLKCRHQTTVSPTTCAPTVSPSEIS
jgi:hypothetical protein